VPPPTSTANLDARKASRAPGQADAAAARHRGEAKGSTRGPAAGHRDCGMIPFGTAERTNAGSQADSAPRTPTCPPADPRRPASGRVLSTPGKGKAVASPRVERQNHLPAPASSPAQQTGRPPCASGSTEPTPDRRRPDCPQLRCPLGAHPNDCALAGSGSADPIGPRLEAAGRPGS